MPYRHLEHLTWADTAFEATAPNLEELFMVAAEATLTTMVADLSTLRERERRDVQLSVEGETQLGAIESVLHDFLQRLVFYKDAEFLLLMPKRIIVQCEGSKVELRAELWGEEINPDRHELLVDVKAVTMHHFSVKREAQGWVACVVLDV